MEPDFEVRHLEDYTEKDLGILFDAVMLKRTFSNDAEVREALDIWGYRIKDAIAIARKRENETDSL